MKTRSILLSATLAALHVTALHASSLSPTDPVTGGIGYRWTVQLGAIDNASFSRHVGAWSWEDAIGPNGDPVGWTHTSDWVALTLAAPATFTLRLERDANVVQPISGDPTHLASTASFYPSFTLWRGWDNDGGDSHTFNNDGALEWAEDLSYVGHVNNSTETFAEATWTLEAGEYSIVLGSNAPANDANRQGYRATFTTVPEPHVALIFALGVGALVSRRTRVGRTF